MDCLVDGKKRRTLNSSSSSIDELHWLHSLLADLEEDETTGLPVISSDLFEWCEKMLFYQMILSGGRTGRLKIYIKT